MAEFHGLPSGVGRPVRQICRLERAGKVVALGHVTAQRGQRCKGRLVLDALGDHA